MTTPEDRALHRRWLHDLTPIPTAAGREFRVIAWIEEWAATRPEVRLERDGAGNLTLRLAHAPTDAGPPLYFTAHMDHPGFVVERIVAPGVVQMSFRGGVMDAYFRGARVEVYDTADRRHAGVVSGPADAPGPFKQWLCEVEGRWDLKVGDVGIWALPAPEERDGLFHALACDDLAALAGALGAFDVLRREGPVRDVRLLLTRAEEIGFVGAIAACRLGTIPAGSTVIALENSRSFAESPIGGGPIVRVGDRLSIFTPRLTDAVARRAEEIAQGTLTRSNVVSSADRTWRWQRKLMAGGACEASVFCDAGFDATCVCLPLGNYHNMGDLAAVEARTNDRPPTIEREFIATADFEGMVDLLIECGRGLPTEGSHAARFARLYDERRFVLEDRVGEAPRSGGASAASAR
ncbi:MAG: M20/M25/M40 family metallo-hydrolase [Planctomycetota bacterium]|nr:M20/M25/M40 family metallo-hydrolase [Planctomycetota bacterium]